MKTRVALQALLLFSLSTAFPAFAQDDEWGDEADEGAVLGDDVGEDAASDDAAADDAAADDAAADDAAADDAAADDAATDDAAADDALPDPPAALDAEGAATTDSAEAPAGDAPVGDAPPPEAAPAGVDAERSPAEEADGEDLDDEKVEGAFERRVGDPMPLTRREPLLPQLGLEVGIRYGLVGTGPTRFVDDIRFGAFDWLELRTALAPYPSSLMARFGIGRAQSPWGVLLLEGGLAHLDAGLRLVPDAGEAEVGVRAHLEAVVAYQVAFAERFSFYTSAHLRSRFSMLSDDDGHAFAVDATLSYDALPYLTVSGGLGYAQTLFGTPVREVALNFVETDRPGMSHFLVRDDGETQSFTIPLALTYGRVENFDVDIFATTRLWPKLDIVFGAGLRWRWWFARKPWEPAA